VTGLWVLIVISYGANMHRVVTMQTFNQHTECEKVGGQIAIAMEKDFVRYWCAPGGRMELP
jgi:hypothetical protein